MTTVKNIYDYIDTFAPFSGQMDFDNAGLLVGNSSQEVKKCLLALDITNDVVKEAAEHDAQLIISHHPVIFNPLKRIYVGTPVYNLISEGISAVCAHTNLDIAAGGVNDSLCRVLELSDCHIAQSDETGLCRIGNLPHSMTAEELAVYVAEKTGNPSVTYCNGEKQISRVGVCGGAGDDFWRSLCNSCDALVTGEVHHHNYIDAAASGFTLICAGHYHTENPVIKVLCDMLSKSFADVEFKIAESGTSPQIGLGI